MRHVPIRLRGPGVRPGLIALIVTTAAAAATVPTFRASAAGHNASPATTATAAAAATVPTLRASAAGHKASPATTASSIGLWAADWGGAASHRSSAGWQAAAVNDSVLIGQPGVYKNWIPQLHAWNPHVTVLTYNLGPYLQKGSPDYTATLQQHPDWFAHDTAGRLINLPMFPNNYLMEMGSAGYRAWHSQQLAATVATYGFDGAMDDSVGAGPLGSYSSGTPKNPATGLAYTATAYLQNAVLLLNSDKAALNGKYLAFNGLVSGQMYAKESSILATSNADAGVSELFLRQPTSPVTSYPTAKNIPASLTMMSDMAAHGKAFLGWTKVWSSGTPAQVAQWEQFALGMYLLGQQNSSYLDFMPSHQADNTTVGYSNLQSQLGAPLGPYVVTGSVYTRSFQNGTVTVNVATDSATIS